MRIYSTFIFLSMAIVSLVDACALILGRFQIKDRNDKIKIHALLIHVLHLVKNHSTCVLKMYVIFKQKSMRILLTWYIAQKYFN